MRKDSWDNQATDQVYTDQYTDQVSYIKLLMLLSYIKSMVSIPGIIIIYYNNDI